MNVWMLIDYVLKRYCNMNVFELWTGVETALQTLWIWSVALEMVDRNSMIKKKRFSIFARKFYICVMWALPSSRRIINTRRSCFSGFKQYLISPQRSHVTFLTLMHETNRYVITFPSCFQPCFSSFEFHLIPFIHIFFVCFFCTLSFCKSKMCFTTRELPLPTAHLDQRLTSNNRVAVVAENKHLFA